MGLNKSKIYVEPLIKLIELNDDPTWLTAFRGLRAGGSLPGGGAGSLNDWGPYYTNKTQQVWYSILYDILRFLFDNNLTPDKVHSFKPLIVKNNIQILRCTNCNNSYQHPSSFERHISLDFFEKNFVTFSKQNNLLELITPKLTYEHFSTIDYRQWLENKYKSFGIKIYDFVNAKYICPHCAADHVPTESDLYLVNRNFFGQKTFNRQKQNATWADFENTSW